MQDIAMYLKNVSGKVQGKVRDSQTAKDLQTLAVSYYGKSEPLTIQEAGKVLKIKFPNYLHQVIKRHTDKVKKIKVKGRTLIIPSNVK